MLKAYDWVIKNLIPGRVPQARLGACGELIGGSLAMMLAFTECRLGEFGVQAAAASNPIVDWVFPHIDREDRHILPDWTAASSNLFEGAFASASPSATSFSSSVSASTLLHARKMLFRKPVHYLDRFASPLFFFRTPGVEVLHPTDAVEADRPKTPPSDEDQVLVKTRKSPRKFPTSPIRLPRMHVSVGEDNVLRPQGEELVKLVRRSIVKSALGERTASDYGDEYFSNILDHGQESNVSNMEAAALNEAERRISLASLPGDGLWNGSNDSDQVGTSMDRIEEIGTWMRNTLS